jgi:hypothetical protein
MEGFQPIPKEDIAHWFSLSQQETISRVENIVDQYNRLVSENINKDDLETGNFAYNLLNQLNLNLLKRMCSILWKENI